MIPEWVSILFYRTRRKKTVLGSEAGIDFLPLFGQAYCQFYVRIASFIR